MVKYTQNCWTFTTKSQNAIRLATLPGLPLSCEESSALMVAKWYIVRPNFWRTESMPEYTTFLGACCPPPKACGPCLLGWGWGWGWVLFPPQCWGNRGEGSAVFPLLLSDGYCCRWQS
jgi:hypothetical protein